MNDEQCSKCRVSGGAGILVVACLLVLTAGCLSVDSPVDEAGADGPESNVEDKKSLDEWGWGDEAEARAARNEVVVLVHGLGRTKLAMVLLGRALEDRGYQVHNWGYSSTCCSVDELGVQLGRELESIEKLEPNRIHFVGHSLGNIIIRQTLGEHPPGIPGRVVMLAPPNQGSHSADRYVGWLGWMLEPLNDLVTEEGSTARSVSRIGDREVGIIAGEDDGKVDVDETRLETQDDHEVVDGYHTFLMNRSDVQRMVADFLETGAFGADD